MRAFRGRWWGRSAWVILRGSVGRGVGGIGWFGFGVGFGGRGWREGGIRGKKEEEEEEEEEG